MSIPFNANHRRLSRRDMLKTILYTSPLALLAPGGLFAGGSIRPLYAPRTPGEESLRVAVVGITGRGRQVFRNLRLFEGSKLKFTALCDVDAMARRDIPVKTPEGGLEVPEDFVNEIPADLPFFTDYRKMLEELHEEIDAVIVCTPDHSHFTITMHAMLLGKHVFVEKPLAQTVQECRLLDRAARETGVVTQMGNQGHSAAGTQQFIEWVRQGIVRDVTRIDAWMNRDRAWYGWTREAYASEPVPENLDWDLWLNRAPYKPYSTDLAPYNWRGWYDFGCGCFGDWGAHILDAVFVALKLGMPHEISCERIGPSDLLYPQGSFVRFKFAARGDMPPVEITWRDGLDNPPPVPPEFDGELGSVGIFIHSADFLQHGTSHGAPYRVVPQEKWREVAPVMTQVKPQGKDHFANFVDACRGHDTASSPFAISAPLSELLCLGCIAQRFGGTLNYDAKAMRITNHKAADAMLRGPEPRPGWDRYYKFRTARSGPTPGYAAS